MSTRDYKLVLQGGNLAALNLHVSPFSISRWAPAVAQYQMKTTPSTMDGDEVKGVRYRNVTEMIEIKIQDGSMPNNLEEMNKIEEFFERARDYQDNPDLDPVYLMFNSSASGTQFESEILAGRTLPHPETLAMRWERDILILKLVILRRPFWYENSGYQVPLTNSYGTDQSVLQVDNTDDATYVNHVTFNDTETPGRRIMPCLLSMKNIDGPPAIGDIFVGLTARGDYTWNAVWEAEDATLNATYSTSMPDANASDGDFVRSTWAIDDEVKLFHFDLNFSDIAAAAGRRFKMLARFNAVPGSSAPLLRWKILIGSDVLWEGPQIQTAAAGLIQDIGTVKIPPWLREATGYGLLDLALFAQVEGGTTLDTDFVLFMPTDAFRKYKLVADGLDDDEELIDISLPSKKRTYVDESGGKVGLYTPIGKPIYIFPNRDQRLHFVFMTDTGLAPIGHSMTVSLRVYEASLTIPHG